MDSIALREGLNTGLISLPNLKQYLDKTYGEDWLEYELETIVEDSDIKITELMADKVYLLQSLVQDSSVYYDDALGFIYSTEIINNNPIDPDLLPHLTSLEIAYSLHVMEKMFPGRLSEDVKKVIAYFLREDGFSEPVKPFDFLDPSFFNEGQTKEDSLKKGIAIKQYILEMDKL